jgi:hypothetical protein
VSGNGEAPETIVASKYGDREGKVVEMDTPALSISARGIQRHG